MNRGFESQNPKENTDIVVREAARLDAALMAAGQSEMSEQSELMRNTTDARIANMIGRIPILGQAVTITGEVLQPGGRRHRLIVVRDSITTISGVYSDMQVRMPYDLEAPDDARRPRRLVHVLFDGPARQTEDKENGNLVTVQPRKFVCARLSMIYPVEPINCHNLDSLLNDEDTSVILEELKNLIDPQDQMRYIEQEVNTVLRRRSGSVGGIGFEIVSELNTREILEDHLLTAEDYLVGEPPSGADISTYVLSNPNLGDIEIKPGKMAILNAYRRSTGKPESITVLPYREVYLRGEEVGGENRKVVVPLSKIKNIHLKEI